MPTASTTRTLTASAAQIWEVVSDPHHLPRWWPRVERVEAVTADSFTEVLRSDRGRIVRADFQWIEREETSMRIVWDQIVAGTPFEQVLDASRTTIEVRPAKAALHGARAPGGARASSELCEVDAGTATAGRLHQQAGCEVRIALAQTLPRWFGGPPPEPVARRLGGRLLSSSFARLGSPMIRRAAAKTIEEALDGLARVAG